MKVRIYGHFFNNTGYLTPGVLSVFEADNLPQRILAAKIFVSQRFCDHNGIWFSQRSPGISCYQWKRKYLEEIWIDKCKSIFLKRFISVYQAGGTIGAYAGRVL